MRVPIRRRFRWAALITIVGTFAVGGIAYASIPDSDGVIHGCYKTVGGALRVTDTSAGRSCTSGEKSLDWNQQGPQGSVATSGVTTLDVGTETLFTLDNGITVSETCGDLLVRLEVSPATPLHLQVSGTTTSSQNVQGQSFSDGNLLSVESFDSVGVDLVARDSTVGRFAHIDVHGSVGSPTGGCTFWWMIIPSS